MQSLNEYRGANQPFVNWFNEVHKWCILGYLDETAPNHAVEDIVLTGSRSTGLAYPASDMEYALVVEDSVPQNDRVDLATVVHNIYKALNHSGHFGSNTLEISQVCTKAGLPLIVCKYLYLADLPGLTKLEMTVRTRTQQAKIVENDAVFLETHTEAELFQYIRDIEKAAASHDEAAYMKLKEWQRVL